MSVAVSSGLLLKQEFVEHVTHTTHDRCYLMIQQGDERYLGWLKEFQDLDDSRLSTGVALICASVTLQITTEACIERALLLSETRVRRRS